jgi:DNA-binding NtrC family response regulator
MDGASPILAVSAEWQTRALLSAQLSEACGRDVVSTPGVDEALALVKTTGVQPVLLVVDAGQQMSPEDVARLMVGLPDTPLVLVASALRRAAFDPLRERCAAYLVRPLSIGAITQAAARILRDTDGVR